jgi:hypothetical protein
LGGLLVVRGAVAVAVVAVAVAVAAVTTGLFVSPLPSLLRLGIASLGSHGACAGSLIFHSSRRTQRELILAYVPMSRQLAMHWQPRGLTQ